MIIVAGHICLDIFPSFGTRTGGLTDLLVPGKLSNVGPALIATGGAVSNAGIALFRLGIPVRLMGMVGDDLFGQAILDVLRRYDTSLADGMIVREDIASSYTVVLNPPGVDRMFLHCPGANDVFTADDVDTSLIQEARYFHFGYPPIMRRMYLDDGAELATLLRRIKKSGLTTSLDMTLPDPEAESGRIDWIALLEQVLPSVDIFLPSLDEILFMLDRPHFEALKKELPGTPAVTVDGNLLAHITGRLLDMGVAVAGLKMGDQGLYIRTTSDRRRLKAMGAGRPADVESWSTRELLAPSFQVHVKGTTGAGDCAIAGFLAGLSKGMAPESAMEAAVAVGACNVESPDATSGVPPWSTVFLRIQTGWARRAVNIPLDDWIWDKTTSIWIGPKDITARNASK